MLILVPVCVVPRFSPPFLPSSPEFIPIAIDLVQAQRASAYAQQMTTSITESAYRSALQRIQASKELHRAMDSGLGRLDPEDTGFVQTGQLATLLRELDLDLTEGEIRAVLAKVRALNKAAAAAAVANNGTAPATHSIAPSVAGTPSSSAPIGIRVLQDNYEELLLSSLQQHHLETEASDVEVYLNALFRKLDRDNSGVLDDKDLTDVLASAPAGVSLSPTQIYAILGDHKPATADGGSEGGGGGQEGNNGNGSSSSSKKSRRYRPFARKAAHMIYMLFDASALAERSSMIRRSAITPIQLLSSSARARIEHSIRAKLAEFDADGDGRLSRTEFGQAMADTNLLLSRSEVDTLFARADKDDDGFVDQEEFVQFSYETLLHLQRDAALKAHMSNALKQKAAAAQQQPSSQPAAAAP
jgi:Ca2+-binding EF-hand superfamily protein